MRKGRSVYEQPGTKVDRVASCQRRDSKQVKGKKRGSQQIIAKAAKGENCATNCVMSCICVYNDCLNV